MRLSTSNETIDALADSFDVVIRGGPDSFPGYTSRFLLEKGGYRYAVRLSWISPR